jgi:hypothetical protein
MGKGMPEQTVQLRKMSHDRTSIAISGQCELIHDQDVTDSKAPYLYIATLSD